MKLVRLFLLSSLLLGATMAQGLEAGAAKIRLVLPPNTPLDGDPSRLGRPATGEHDALWARCLYLDDGTSYVYLVNVDLYRIAAPLRAEVIARSEEFAAKESIILTATHTRNGPGGMNDGITDRWTSGRKVPETLQAVSEAIVSAMIGAQESKRRATLGYGTGRQRILAVNTLRDGGAVDEQIGVIRVDDADGKAIAIATNFAAAPLLVPEAFKYRFSAGYPGAYYRSMEELTDPGCVALFFMGAGGDQAPGNPDNGEGWARIDSVGKELALGAKAVANDMTFHDTKLTISYREIQPPSGFADARPASTAVLQTLAIDDLLLTFIPGMPDVDLGLALRRQAIAAGHSAQFTVGLANGYWGYLTSRANYTATRAPGTAQRFGPEMEAWLYEQVSALVRQEAPAPTGPVVVGGAGSGPEGGAITLRGTGHQRGYQRGAAFGERIGDLYAEKVLEPLRAGTLRPPGPFWPMWPGFLDPAPVALPELGITARTLLQGADGDLFDEVEGYAAGAGLHFDAAWLLQTAAYLASPEDTPADTEGLGDAMFAWLGGSGGASFVAYRCALEPEDEALVSVVEPESGHRYLQLGLDWQLGALAGINDAGVAISVERSNLPERAASPGLPVTMLVQQVLRQAGDYVEALEALRAATYLRNCRVLVAGPSPKGRRATTITYGTRLNVRTSEEGLHRGLDPEEDRGSPAALAYYREIAEAVPEEAAMELSTARVLLGAPGDGGAANQVVLRLDRLALEVTTGEGEAARTYTLREGAGRE